jgi:hypothetical protein
MSLLTSSSSAVTDQGIERRLILVRGENTLELGEQRLHAVVGEKAGGHESFRDLVRNLAGDGVGVVLADGRGAAGFFNSSAPKESPDV